MVEWIKLRIKSKIWNIRKQKKTPKQKTKRANQNNKKKKESKKTRIVYATSGTTSRGPSFTS